MRMFLLRMGVFLFGVRAVGMRRMTAMKTLDYHIQQRASGEGCQVFDEVTESTCQNSFSDDRTNDRRD